MKKSLQCIYLSLQNNSPLKIDYSKIKLSDIKEKDNSILYIITEYIFFVEENDNFSLIKIKENKAKYQWYNELFEAFVVALELIKEEGLNSTCNLCCRLFSHSFEYIKKYYENFIKSLKILNIELDLFSCIISFFSYSNGNKKYLSVFSELNKDINFKEAKKSYEERLKSSLWYTLVDYCTIKNIPILYTYEKDKENNIKDTVNEEINELKIFVDLCPVNELFKNFVEILYIYIKDSNHCEFLKSKKVNEFIEFFFQTLNIYLQNSKYWEDYNLAQIIDYIYSAAYNFSSEDFNENYLDFVICYWTKYEKSDKNFIFLFFKGLIKNEFNKTFRYLNLGDFNADIDDKEIIQNLVVKINKKKKKAKKKSTAKKNEIKDSKIIIKKPPNEEKQNNLNKNISETSINKQQNNSKNENTMTIEKNNLLKENTNKNEITEEMNKKFEIMQKQIDTMQEKMKDMQNEIEDMKNEIEELNEDNEIKTKQININNIKISKLNSDFNSLKTKLEIISFRDLSKRILDNMIQYIEKKDKNFFFGLFKRKKKIDKLINNFNFPQIRYMEKPIQEISEKYYNSNNISHVPTIVENMKKNPYGILDLSNKDVAKKFYDIMVNSKNDNVFSFLIQELNIEKEIDSIYLLKKSK